MKDGYLTQLNCKNQTRAAKLAIYQNMNLYEKFGLAKKSLESEIFEACTKPKPGTGITASFFHLVPLINILEVPGEIVYFHSIKESCCSMIIV